MMYLYNILYGMCLVSVFFWDVQFEPGSAVSVSFPLTIVIEAGNAPFRSKRALDLSVNHCILHLGHFDSWGPFSSKLFFQSKLIPMKFCTSLSR